MKRIIFIVTTLCSALSLTAGTATYTGDNSSLFQNPERGWYKMIECHLSGNGGETISANQAARCYTDQGLSILLLHYYMEPYSNGSKLTNNDLNRMRTDLNNLRTAGVKAIMRFSYGNEYYDDNNFCQDASEENMYKHMDQIKTVLAENADVIACVQAGFVGVWGEWYYSSTFGIGFADDPSAKNRLITHLLDMTPTNRYMQLRTPEYITGYTGDRSRLGHHNDAFLNGRKNLGTYVDVTEDKAYVANLGLTAPIGGETCLIPDQSDAESIYADYSTGAKADEEMAYLHYDYLNMDYSRYVLDRWENEYYNNSMSYYNRIGMRMGYRLQLVSASLSDEVAPNGELQVQLKIRNTGYSSIYNKRTAYIVLVKGSTTKLLPLASDPRTWESGEETTITESLPVGSLALGTYQAYLWLPDEEQALRSNPRFSIRLANPNIWDATTGRNALGLSVTVTNGADPSIDPVPEYQSCEEAPDLTTARTLTGQPGSSTISVANDVLTVNYTTYEGWSHAGAEIPLDNRDDIDSISFEFLGSNTGNGWTAFEVYLWDGQNCWVENEADLSVHSDRGWISATIRPNQVLWGNPGSPAGIPMTAIGFMANPNVAVSGTFQVRNVVIHTVCETPTEVEETDIEAVKTAAAKAVKLLRNGHMYIIRDGVAYDLTGRSCR